MAVGGKDGSPLAVNEAQRGEEERKEMEEGEVAHD